MSDDSVYLRMLRNRIGIAAIPPTMIKGHQYCRAINVGHIAVLKDVNTRWAHPRDIVIRDQVDSHWLQALRENRFCETPPPSGRFWCSSGHHRLVAAMELVAEWNPSAEENEMDPQLCYWPANVYKAGLSPTLSPCFIVAWLINRENRCYRGQGIAVLDARPEHTPAAITLRYCGYG